MAPVAPKMSVHRAKALARIADPTLPRQVHRADNAVTDGFLHSKRDKQLIKRSAFRAKVAEKASPALRRRGGGVTKSGGGGGVGSSTAASSSSGKTTRRVRRPSKKLVTTLQSLVDALPDVDNDGGDGDDNDTVAADGTPQPRKPAGEDELARRLRRARTSLRTRPGALRRKEKLVRAEMARFGASLAELTKTQEDVVVPASTPMETETEADTTDTTHEAAAPPPPPPPKQSTANRYALLRNFITATMEQNPAFAK